MTEWDRGVEAGAASGFIVGTVVGIMFIVGFFLFNGKFWEGFLGISRSLVLIIVLALSVAGLILFSLSEAYKMKGMTNKSKHYLKLYNETVEVLKFVDSKSYLNDVRTWLQSFIEERLKLQ